MQRLRDEGLIKEIEYQPQRLGELAGVILTLDGIETALGHIFTALQRERKHIRGSLGADERTILEGLRTNNYVPLVALSHDFSLQPSRDIHRREARRAKKLERMAAREDKDNTEN